MAYTTLIDAPTLAKHLANSNWVIFDCRFSLKMPAQGREEYKHGHIPGAVYADLDLDLAAPQGPATGRHPLPEVDAFTGWLRRCGVNNHSQVVVYDANGAMFAARLWWMLRWLNHDNVAVLDGGWPAWVAGSYPTSREIPQPEAGDFAGEPDQGKWVTSQEVEELVRSNSKAKQIVDARVEPRFKGEFEPIDPIAGHIPGACNYPCGANVDDQGRFHAAAQLRDRFHSLFAGRSPGEIINMCGSGVTACRNILAMEIAGWPGTKLYVGSWSEWITDPQRSIEAVK